MGAMTVRDAIVTSKSIIPDETAENIESAIDKAVAEFDIQNAIAGQLETILKSDPRVRLATVDASGPDKPAARPDYAQLRDEGIDTVIEIGINEIGLDGCITHNWECRPPHTLYLFMRGQARMVQVVDGATLFEWPLEYKSGAHDLSKWQTDGGRILGEELEQAYRELAERVYDEAFLITPIALPFVSNIWEEKCWVEPLSVSGTDTLQPTLRWTPFPSEIVRQELDPAVLRKIGNVTYDLRVWDEDIDQGNDAWYQRWRNRLIYERTGLAAPQHTLEVPLAPASRYYWSVRARFVVDGRSMATRWMRQHKCFSYEVSYGGDYGFDTPK